MRLETKLVEEETHQVNKAIEDQTNELNAQVADMRSRHEQLVLDVAELEQLLEAKRREGACVLRSLGSSRSRSLVQPSPPQTHTPSRLCVCRAHGLFPAR